MTATVRAAETATPTAAESCYSVPCVNSPPNNSREVPWSNHPRERERTRAFRRIAETSGYGIKFARLAEELHGSAACDGPSAGYKRLDRFVGELGRDGLVSRASSKHEVRTGAVKPHEDAVYTLVIDDGDGEEVLTAEDVAPVLPDEDGDPSDHRVNNELA